MSSEPTWEELQMLFRRETIRRGPTQMARDLPASRQSVYNWMEGERTPCKPALKRITEILNENEE